MADRVYPATRPAPPPSAAANGSENPKFPPTKGQLYTPATRPMYRAGAAAKHRRSRRSCCCRCFLWTFLLLFILAVVIAIAGAAAYVIYRPQRPAFSVASLQLAQFNLTGAALAARFNFTVTARNPNKKIVYFYDPISIAVSSSGVAIGDASFPAFEHRTKNSTTLKAVVVSHSDSGSDLDTLRSEVKKSGNSLPLKLQLDTKVKAKIGGLKTKKVAIRVKCEGIKVGIPTGKTPTTASTSKVKCKVDLRIKIWKWTF